MLSVALPLGSNHGWPNRQSRMCLRHAHPRSDKFRNKQQAMTRPQHFKRDANNTDWSVPLPLDSQTVTRYTHPSMLATIAYVTCPLNRIRANLRWLIVRGSLTLSTRC
jgi:hypothetical protein